MVMRELRRDRKQTPLLIKDKEGVIQGSTEGKLEQIKNHFKEALAPENMKEEFKTYPPTKMKQPFTKEEITKVSKRLKSGKSAGIDQLNAELIKYAPEDIHNEIADIYNNMAETGDSPDELTQGLLSPLQKPGKPRGPTSNLRPIILLSIIRKILTICMLDRIWNRLATLIPKSQAAYQGGRGTTEQVLALKLMVEKALTTNDFELYIILLDMSKAFDTVNRRILLTELEQVLNPDEMHILALLTNRPKIQIKLNEETSEEFQSYQGICQGDCLSAVLFIFYLARALKDEPIPSPKHSYIDPKYADDITYATTDKTHIPKIKEEIPKKN